MHKFLKQYPEYPMKWYALPFSYFFGLLANDYFLHALFLLVLFYFIIKSKELSLYIVTLFCFLFGFIMGAKPLEIQKPTWLTNTNQEYTAYIENVRSLPDERLRLILSNVKDENNNTLPAKTVLYIYYDKVNELNLDSMPIKGMNISFNARVQPVSFSKNPGILPAEIFWHNQNVYYTSYLTMPNTSLTTKGEGTFLAKARNTLYIKYVEQCKDAAGTISPAKALLISILFGERFFLTTDTLQIFTETSLVHTLALSGMHLGFVGLCAFVLSKLLVHLKPKILYKFPFPILLGFFSLPLALAYLWLGNMPISLIRASCMLIIFWFALIMYKRLSLLDNLIMTASLILLILPRAWADISFQLSFLAVLSIALTAPLFTEFKNYLISKNEERKLSLTMKFLLFFLALFWTSFTIQIALYPIQAYTFGTISPYFILNIIWIPLIEFLILPSAFLSLFTVEIPSISQAFIAFASAVTDIFINLLNYLNRSEISLIQGYRFDLWQGIGFYLLIFSIIYYKLLAKSTYICMICSLVLLFSAPIYKLADNVSNQDRVNVTLLDVGQGQSVLIEWSEGYKTKRALIDAGGVFGNRFDTGKDTVAKVLTYQAMPKLDYAFVSHFDSDHAKGMFHIVDHFNIENFLYSFYSKNEDMRKNLLADTERHNIAQYTLEVGDILPLIPNKLWFEVLFPPPTGNFSSNNSSLVLRLVYKGKGLALICGDSEGSAISRMLELDNTLKAELLILPHHGSGNSYNESFYAHVQPNFVVASASYNNRYGFPSKKIVEYFQQQNIKVDYTGKLGAIKYTFNDGVIE